MFWNRGFLPLLKDYALFVREFSARGRNFGSYMTFNKDRKNKNKIPIVPIGKENNICTYYVCKP